MMQTGGLMTGSNITRCETATLLADMSVGPLRITSGTNDYDSIELLRAYTQTPKYLQDDPINLS